MLGILVVCTGNVCRSPLAEHLLREELRDADVSLTSRGTRALRDQPPTPETIGLATSLGIPVASISEHRAQQLREAHLAEADLVLTMAREHRREVVELSPVHVRSTFLLRELGRLGEAVPDAELTAVANAAGRSSRTRLDALLQRVAAVRGELPPPTAPGEDDVIDPFRRSEETYRESASQMASGIAQVVRLTRIAEARPLVTSR
ncbi:low molecular weight phosphatase family protein [Microbacterium sp. X-17]|uniref:arsenate reductase/protein-tyrosine-phosphatase family protein n=1 Tax=Microbacterium sp. X-17 TaxID=3144404 RepID=UPI0031F4C0E4